MKHQQDPVEDRIDRILESLRGLEKAQASPYLWEKIRIRLWGGVNIRERNLVLRPVFAWLLVLLLGINIISWWKAGTGVSRKANLEAVSAGYFPQDQFHY